MENEASIVVAEVEHVSPTTVQNQDGDNEPIPEPDYEGESSREIAEEQPLHEGEKECGSEESVVKIVLDENTTTPDSIPTVGETSEKGCENEGKAQNDNNQEGFEPKNSSSIVKKDPEHVTTADLSDPQPITPAEIAFEFINIPRPRLIYTPFSILV